MRKPVDNRECGERMETGMPAAVTCCACPAERLFASLARRLPSRQIVRYLVVGIWNTLFGYGVFALCTYLLTDRVPYAYMVACVINHVVCVTVAFFGYKWFVFKTKGNYWREYWRCNLVYGAGFPINFTLLPVLVWGFHHIVGPQPWIPYLVWAILTLGTVIVSFIGHRQFSFAEKK